MLNKEQLETAMPFFSSEMGKYSGWGSVFKRVGSKVGGMFKGKPIPTFDVGSLSNVVSKNAAPGIGHTIKHRASGVGKELLFGLESAAVAGGIPIAASAFIPRNQSQVTRSYGMN